MWVRGLKRVFNIKTLRSTVAPYVGAWIETWNFEKTENTILWSHPMWVRGLKLYLSLFV